MCGIEQTAECSAEDYAAERWNSSLTLETIEMLLTDGARQGSCRLIYAAIC